ncbi:MAG: cation transporter [Spirochaetes bacterium]|nr:cation transporter [Spirochaetota bacterium]
MKNNNRLINIAMFLSFFTIFYNVIEGLVSVLFGAGEESLALFGFGIDSFVEVISGIGIFHFTMRLKYDKIEKRDKFEKQALLITGISFILLFISLVIGSVINIIQKNKPYTTLPGIIISLISISFMLFLIVSKIKVGKKLGSDAIIADAKCSMTCFYLSIILLLSSILYEVFKIGLIDIIGSLGIAYFALKEGIEAIDKSQKNNTDCSCSDC